MKGSEFSSCKDHWWKRASTGLSVLRLLGQAPPELEMPGLWRRGHPDCFFCHIGDAPGSSPSSLGGASFPGWGQRLGVPLYPSRRDLRKLRGQKWIRMGGRESSVSRSSKLGHSEDSWNTGFTRLLCFLSSFSLDASTTSTCGHNEAEGGEEGREVRG